MSTSAVQLNSQHISAVSRLFSAAVLRDLSRRASSDTFSRIVKEVMPSGFVEPTDRVAHFFNAVFERLKKPEHRNEYVYKAALTHKVLLGRHSLKTTAMLSEFGVGENKADCVMLNGTSAIYEIKSERDSLKRLKQQIEAYRKVSAEVNVITGYTHLEKVVDLVPEDVGILLLTNRYQISTFRKALCNPERTEAEAIFYSIRLNEVKQIVKNLGLKIPDVPNTKLYGALQEIFTQLEPVTAHDEMVRVLKKTRSSSALGDYIHKVPYSLRAAVLSSKSRKSDRERFLRVLNGTVQDLVEVDTS